MHYFVACIPNILYLTNRAVLRLRIPTLTVQEVGRTCALYAQMVHGIALYVALPCHTVT